MQHAPSPPDRQEQQPPKKPGHYLRCAALIAAGAIAGIVPAMRTVMGATLGGLMAHALAAKTGVPESRHRAFDRVGSILGLVVGLSADVTYFSPHPLYILLATLSSVFCGVCAAVIVTTGYVPKEHTGR